MHETGVGPANITQMLRDWGEGKTEAADQLLIVVYSELHRQVAGFLRRERRNHTLQTTDLIHETYLKLVDQKHLDWKCRGHFFAIAATSMRRILIDHAKKKRRAKRGGAENDIPLEDVMIAAAESSDIDLLALNDALSRLARLDPQQGRIVELRYFGGLSLEDAANSIGISRATAARDWQVAKAWLHRELTR